MSLLGIRLGPHEGVLNAGGVVAGSLPSSWSLPRTARSEQPLEALHLEMLHTPFQLGGFIRQISYTLGRIIKSSPSD